MHESAKNADTEIIGYRHLYSDKYERVPSELKLDSIHSNQVGLPKQDVSLDPQG